MAIAAVAPSLGSRGSGSQTVLDATSPRVFGRAPSHAPLVCDDAGDGAVAYVFHQSAAFFAPYQPHGGMLLVVERSCRYHVFTRARGTPGELRSGSLTADELDELNADVLTADWSALDGEHVNLGTVADAPTLTLRRDDLHARCDHECAPHERLAELAARSTSWVGRLWDRGALIDGPVDVDAFHPSGFAPRDAPSWTGNTDLAALFADSPYPTFVRARVDDREDAARLRQLRTEADTAGSPPFFLEQGGALFDVGVADVLPFEVELYDDRAGVPWQ